MTDQHPIIPSQELIEQWTAKINSLNLKEQLIMVAQWGANQELEACCEWTSKHYPYIANYTKPEVRLRTARRPKPPSLKEQALEALQFVDEKLDLPLHNHCNAIHTIRTALEALPND